MEDKYVMCEHCKGIGETQDYTTLQDVKTGKTWISTKLCLRCFGEGKLDWIENIKGIRHLTDKEMQIKISIHYSTIYGRVEQQ